MTEPGSSDPRPARSWQDFAGTPQQALEWGITLCGQLATVHARNEVVGRIAPETIARSPFDQPSLPEPDSAADHDRWVDVAALGVAIGSIVADPPGELTNALLPPYASAVALGQELQDAQRAMGLAVAPIPFAGAPRAEVGGEPLEMPSPEPADARQVDPTSGAPPDPTPADVDVGDPVADLGFDPETLANNPNLRVLLAIIVFIAVAAIAVGIGWR